MRTWAAEDDEASRIIWIGGASPARRGTPVDRWRQQLQVSGHPIFVLDKAALGALNGDLDGEPSGESIRRAREVARLLARAGVNVIVDVTGSESDAYPGKWIDADAPDANPSDDWVI